MPYAIFSIHNKKVSNLVSCVSNHKRYRNQYAHLCSGCSYPSSAITHRWFTLIITTCPFTATFEDSKQYWQIITDRHSNILLFCNYRFHHHGEISVEQLHIKCKDLFLMVRPPACFHHPQWPNNLASECRSGVANPGPREPQSWLSLKEQDRPLLA